MSDDTKAIIAGVVRHGLTVLAGVLAAKGINLDNDTVQVLASAAVALVGVGWSVLHKKGAAV